MMKAYIVSTDYGEYEMKKVTLTRYIKDNGKIAYVVNYGDKYFVLKDLSEFDKERLESTFYMVIGACVGMMESE